MRDDETPEVAAMQRFRFPYPVLQVIALLTVVVFAGGYSLMTHRQIVAGPGATEAVRYVLGMYGFTVALALFVGGAMAYRARLMLEVGPEELVLRRLHWRASARRVALPWHAVERVLVRADPRGIWYLWVESGLLRQRLPLAHAVADGERRAQAPQDAQSAAAHPLVVALREHLGERLEVARR